MNTQMTINGISTTTERDSEQWEWFYTLLCRKRVRRIAYDHRNAHGRLFSCVAKTLKEARAKRDDYWRRNP